MDQGQPLGSESKKGQWGSQAISYRDLSWTGISLVDSSHAIWL